MQSGMDGQVEIFKGAENMIDILNGAKLATKNFQRNIYHIQSRLAAYVL